MSINSVKFPLYISHHKGFALGQQKQLINGYKIVVLIGDHRDAELQTTATIAAQNGRQTEHNVGVKMVEGGESKS